MKYERDRLSAWIIKIAIALCNKAVFLPVHVHVRGLTWKVRCDHTPLAMIEMIPLIVEGLVLNTLFGRNMIHLLINKCPNPGQ